MNARELVFLLLDQGNIALTKGLFLLPPFTGGDHHPPITAEVATDLDPDLDPIHLVSRLRACISKQISTSLELLLSFCVHKDCLTSV